MGFVNESPDAKQPRLDPVFAHARREGLVMLAIWAGGFVWTVGYCAWAGYGEATAELPLILGLPHWIFWGVFAPWVATGLAAVGFALWGMADDDLEPPPAQASEDSARD